MSKRAPAITPAHDAVQFLQATGRTAIRRRTRSQPHISYLEIPSGQKVGSGPLLMLHGVGSSADTWRRLLPYLHTGKIIAPDYRGHGYSDSPEPPYCLEDFVSDIRRLLDELEIERIDVLGFSIGALFAAKLALNHPSCVKSLILLNSIADRTPEQKIRARERLEFLSTHLPDETAPATAVRWFTPAFLVSHDDLVEAEAGITVSTPHAPYASSYRVLVENDLIDEVSGISCPTLIMTGELDEGSTPAMSEALHRQIPGSLLRIIGGVKHYMHFERPEELARHVNEFLKQADTAAVEI